MSSLRRSIAPPTSKTWGSRRRDPLTYCSPDGPPLLSLTKGQNTQWRCNVGFFDKIQDTISSATEQTKAKAQDVQLKRDKTHKLAGLGEQAYNLYLNGQLANQELAAACQEIADLDRRIAEAEAAAQAARPQPAAPQAQGGYAPPPGAPAAAAPPPPAAAAPPPPAAPPQAAPPPPGVSTAPPPPPAAPPPPPPPGVGQE